MYNLPSTKCIYWQRKTFSPNYAKLLNCFA